MSQHTSQAAVIPGQTSDPLEVAIAAFRLCDKVRGLNDPLLTALFEMACQGIAESLTEDQLAEALSLANIAGAELAWGRAAQWREG